jgi:hypothetical protein
LKSYAPVHRGCIIAMSGRIASAQGLDFETCKTTNPMTGKRRLAPQQGFADNLRRMAHNQSGVKKGPP